MPPGVSKTNVKKRKASGGSDESSEEQQEQLLVAGRQRRTAALKSHKVWDQLKPGAAKHFEGEDEHFGEIPTPGTSTKRNRITPKRVTKISQGNEEELGEQAPQQIAIKTGQKQLMDAKQSQQEPMRVIISAEKKEIEKHDQFDESDQEFSDEEEEDDEHEDEHSARYVLDDPNDEDFVDASSRAKRGGGVGIRDDPVAAIGRGRGIPLPARAGGIIASGPTSQMPIPIFQRGMAARGRPRGGRAAPGIGGVMRGRIMRQPMNYFSSPNRQMANGIYSLQPGGGGGVGDLASSRTGPPPVVRVLRPAGMSIQSNFQPLRPSLGGGINQHQISETSFTVNRELENYRGRIVAETSVHEFNEIIDHLLAEYQRVVDDRSRLIANHRDFVTHMKQSHQTAQDLKDYKIRSLEQTIEQLQRKVVMGIKQEQLRVVKQGSLLISSGVGGEGQQGNASVGQQQQQQGGHQQIGVKEELKMEGDVLVREHSPPTQEQQQHIDVCGEGDQLDEEQMIGGEGGRGVEGGGGGGQVQQQQQQAARQQQQIWQQPQRVRILGAGRGGGGEHALPQLHSEIGPNATYFDEEMDEDEEFDDEEDGGEMDDELGAQVTI